jgi:hypothetical protein
MAHPYHFVGNLVAQRASNIWRVGAMRRRQARIWPTGTYTDWRWPAAAAGYTSFEWELTPLTNPAPDGYFWSHQFWLVGGEAGYLGLQTVGSASVGKIAVFSIWNATSSEGPAEAGPFTGEGDGFTARLPYEWEVGSTYRLTVETTVAGRWSATVARARSASADLIGHIHVPAGWGGLRDTSVMWTERYSGPMASCDDIRYSRARFSAPTANGVVTAVAHRNYLNESIGCPGSSVTDVDGGVIHVMGERGS